MCSRPSTRESLEAEAPQGAHKSPMLAPRRLSEPFEALRARSDAHLAASGARPRVFLANLGSVATFTPRANFAKNFFEAGGVEAVFGPQAEDVGGNRRGLPRQRRETRLSLLVRPDLLRCGDSRRDRASRARARPFISRGVRASWRKICARRAWRDLFSRAATCTTCCGALSRRPYEGKNPAARGRDGGGGRGRRRNQPRPSVEPSALRSRLRRRLEFRIRRRRPAIARRWFRSMSSSRAERVISANSGASSRVGLCRKRRHLRREVHRRERPRLARHGHLAGTSGAGAWSSGSDYCGGAWRAHRGAAGSGAVGACWRGARCSRRTDAAVVDECDANRRRGSDHRRRSSDVAADRLHRH